MTLLPVIWHRIASSKRYSILLTRYCAPCVIAFFLDGRNLIIAKLIGHEAKSLALEAKSASASASTKDSVSKLQLKQVPELLKKGDEASARELSRQSQLTADSAQHERTVAHQLDSKAKIKRAEADSAWTDAQEWKRMPFSRLLKRRHE